MACTVNLQNLNISYACGDIFTGGLKAVYLADRADVLANAGVTLGADDEVSFTGDFSVSGVTVVELGFNNKDGFSNFTDVKTVNADGSSSAVPTIQMEFARMDLDKRTALDEIAKGGAEMVAFIETAAGTYHMVGYQFGLYASSVDGASGTARTDKNRYQVTLTGEENSLAYIIDGATEFAKVGA